MLETLQSGDHVIASDKVQYWIFILALLWRLFRTSSQLELPTFFQKHCKFSLSWESYLSLKHFRKGQGSSSRNRLVNCILYRVIHLRLSKKANVSPSKSILCCSEIQRVNRFDRVIYFLKVFLSLFPYCAWFSAVCLQSPKKSTGISKLMTWNEKKNQVYFVFIGKNAEYVSENISLQQ